MGPNQGRKARVIAKIKGFTDLEPDSVKEASKNWISVHRPNGNDSETVTVSFGGDESTSRKESYDLDYCYYRSEENDLIFPREVKPLVEDIFNGYNATVIAYGARGSGKTYTIQGTEEKPGLAILAMSEILSMAKESGKSISISCYEISKDHAYDLLDPNRHEVFVLEDVARGKIQLKGLSQVPVKSIEEFRKLYLSSQNATKQSQKIIVEPHHRSHKVLIVNVFQLYRSFECSDALPLGKMNFVDLAGYEDGRKSTGGVNLVENNKINKSIYAVHNVVYALNANESHVPYRESKLTRMLRDSLGGRNKILIITCLNPSFCQDSLYMANLASRSCKGANRTIPDSTKQSKSTVRPMVVSSSSKSRLLGSLSATATKQIGTREGIPGKKANVKAASANKARKLFDETRHSTKSKKAAQEESLPLEIVSAITEQATQEEEKDSSGISKARVCLAEFCQEHSLLQNFSAEESDMPVKASTQETKVNVTDENDHDKTTPNIDSNAKALSFVEADQTIDKENNLLLVNKDDSPPISKRLQELSNNLKMLYCSTPSCIDILPKSDGSFDDLVQTEISEPKTPEPRLLLNDKSDMADGSCSSWKAFSARSSRMKDSLVDEYLRFLNTASKDELKRLKGMGEKRATYILELRDESPEPFKDLDGLKDIGLSEKQIKGIVSKEIGGLFN